MDFPEEKPQDKRKNRVIFALVVIIAVGIVLVLLALLSPAIGNVFTNIMGVI